MSQLRSGTLGTIWSCSFTVWHGVLRFVHQLFIPWQEPYSQMSVFIRIEQRTCCLFWKNSLSGKSYPWGLHNTQRRKTDPSLGVSTDYQNVSFTSLCRTDNRFITMKQWRPRRQRFHHVMVQGDDRRQHFLYNLIRHINYMIRITNESGRHFSFTISYIVHQNYRFVGGTPLVQCYILSCINEETRICCLFGYKLIHEGIYFAVKSWRFNRSTLW